MANKMTKRDWFNKIKAIDEVAANAGMVAFIDRELELLTKKSSGNRKPTATQLANESIKDEIRKVLSDGKSRTVSEIIKAGDFSEDITTQKISALLTLLKNAGEVQKTSDKKKSYFTLVIADADEDEEETDDEIQALDREITV